MKETILYIALSPEVEIRLSLQTRFYNGIHSDPKVLTRVPSLNEVLQITEKIRARAYDAFSDHSALDYPQGNF